MSTDATPQPDVPAAAPGLRRSTSDRVFLGVCGGIAARFGLAPVAVRVAFVVLAFLVVGVPLYLALSIAYSSDSDPPPLRLLLGLLVGAVAFLVIAGLGLTLIDVPSAPIVALLLLGAGAGLILGRRRTAATRVGDPAEALLRRPGPRPPALLLLTAAAALVAATVVWLVIRGSRDVEGFGAIAASVLVIVGLGQCLGAWRGRSFLLLPAGAALAVPLAVAAFADVRADLGSDNPGVLGVGAETRSFDLGRGAGPVIVTKEAVEKGLRELTVRKPAGYIDIRLPRQISAHITMVNVGGNSNAFSLVGNGGYVAGTGVGPTTFTFAGQATGKAAPPTLDLRVESVVGNISIRHGDEAGLRRNVAAEERAFRLREIRRDLRGRRALLARERRTFTRLNRAYAQATAAAASTPAAVAPGVLRVGEGQWFQSSPTSPWIVARDPALKRLARVQAVRYDVLRAAWRVRTVERGIRPRQAELRALLAAAPTRRATP